LEDIVGTEIYKGIVLEITKHYKKSNLTVALVLLDKINVFPWILSGSHNFYD